ncbi:MAG TPA: CopG family transcriptional regulator [Burkholderiaceae bacterium]|nr:CopG family transcriptional regulator [Burkholderiaceae bacterium]
MYTHQSEQTMSRLTITLSEARYRALKEASVQRDKTIGQLIDESLEFYGIKSRERARDLVRRARARSKLDEEQALEMAQQQVRAVRRKS